MFTTDEWKLQTTEERELSPSSQDTIRSQFIPTRQKPESFKTSGKCFLWEPNTTPADELVDLIR